MEKKYQFNVLIEQDEDGMYVASIPALKGCHTQARSIDELWPSIREAVDLCLEAQTQEEPPMRFVGVQQLEFVS